MKLKTALLCIFFTAVFSGCPEAKMDNAATDIFGARPYGATAVHTALTSENRWLNVSRALTARDLKGRILLIDFWTFCCINCLQVIPDLKRLERDFGDRLTVIGVHSAKFTNEKDTDNIRAAVLRYGIEHPVVNDSDFRIWQSFDVHAWPTLILVSPDGSVQLMLSGEGHYDTLKAAIHQLIMENAWSLNTAPLPIRLEKEKAPPALLKFPGKITYLPLLQGEPALLISDSSNNRIIAARTNGEIFLQIGSGKEGSRDGSLETAEFNSPQGLLTHENRLFVADTENHLIREVDLDKQRVTTIAGTGRQGYIVKIPDSPALETSLSSPWDLSLLPDEKRIAVANAGTHQLLVYDVEKKTLSPLAGNGREAIDDGIFPGNSLSQPSGLGRVGEKIYLVDSETSSLRVLEDGRLTTLIGTGLFDFGFINGKQGRARMQHPLGVYAEYDAVYIADSYNHSIRVFDPVTSELSTLAGRGKRGFKDGKISEALFNEPNGIIKVGSRLFVTDTNNHRLRVIDLEKRSVSTITLFFRSRERERRIVEQLPNPEKAGEITVASSTAVALDLPPGWKINDIALSWLALFKTESGKTALVREWNERELKNRRVSLPELEKGESYRIQGTFYYCRENESSNCLIKSYDRLLHTAPGPRPAGEIVVKLLQ